jgi:hypothetical protein
MNLLVNELLKNSQTNRTFRVLWVDNGNVLAYLIDVEDKKALPFAVEIKEIKEELIEDELIKIKKDDFLPVVSDKITEKNIAIRDKAWSVIGDIVTNVPDIFNRDKRGEMVSAVMEKHAVTKPTVYKYLRRYWQRGQTPNTLLPNYNKSGGKGKEKSCGSRKRGRPRKKSTGINVDQSIKKIFRVALEKYYLTTKKNSIPAAYNMMIKEFYAEDYYYEDGIKKIIIADKDELPSLCQFRYWFNKEYNVEEVTIARQGRKKYEKDFRAVLGSSTAEVIGPGSRYQIDATVADVYLISRYNPDWIIGRPVIYLVIDVFSRLITGIYIGLEGPSWIGAMMALANVAADKQKFCHEYGIEISKEAWPVQHFPEILLADRGELEGYNVERLISALNLHVENTTPYRADWKGIVEKQFDTIQRKVKPFLPGYVDKDFQERGARDYRLDGKLTIEQFTQLILKQVIYYNTKHYLKDYLRDVDMIEDEVEPIPLNLWNWGLQNRSGKLRYFPEELIKLQLLPQSKAKVTYRGIRLEGMYYSCEQAIKESWFPTARQKGSWKVKAAFDPRDMSSIYLMNDKNSFEICHLLEGQKRYENKTLDEIRYLHEYEKQMEEEAEHGQLQKEVDIISELEAIKKQSVKRTNKQQSKTISKAQKTKAIKENRKKEREARRKEEAFVLGEKPKENKPAEIISLNDRNDIEEEYKRPTIKEFLRKKGMNPNNE